MRGLIAAAPVSAVLILVFLQPAYAYLDPGTGTMLLQALIGGIAGMLVFGRVYWARLKTFVGRLTISTGGSNSGER